ncbi:MAG: PAS domain-containing protein [Alphaproteobacteria bacterium]|nr:PAS domain-containing protein [Alphaproteobacteria bacterium]
MANRSSRIQISLSEEETGLIDDWRFQNRIPSRAAAIRELIGRSIDSAPLRQDANVSSRDIGVRNSALQREGRPTFSVCDARAPDTPLIYVSQAFCDMCEYRADEMLGRNCRFLQGPMTRKSAKEELRAGIENAAPVEVELVNYRKSGVPYLVSVRVEPVFMPEDDRPMLFVGTQRYRGEA